jgi:phenylalanyl-tRNA synthetase alpha chain
MLENLNQIEKDALLALEAVTDTNGLEQWRIAYLGRSSDLMRTFDQLGQVAKEERPVIGRRANQVKQNLEAHLAQKEAQIQEQQLNQLLVNELLDVTLPGRVFPMGRLHPTT